MAPTAQELLAEAAASGEDLESVARGLLARLLNIRTFVSYPVFTVEGRWFGTLCGASKDQVQIEDELLELMRECARLIGERIHSPNAPSADLYRGGR